MAPEQHEIEATFLVHSPAPKRVIQTLEGLQRLGEFDLQPETEQNLHDHYFDLPDASLRKRGLSLRLRRSGLAWLLCLKRSGQKEGLAVRRLEIEGPASDRTLRQRIASEAEISAIATLELGADPPGALARTGFVIIHDRRTRRRRRTIRSASDRPLASLVIDSVDFEVYGSHLWHHEVEIEAAGEAEAELLQELAASLQQTFPEELVPWRPSKLRIGLALQSLVRRAGTNWLVGPEGDLLPRSYALLLQELRSGS